MSKTRHDGRVLILRPNDGRISSYQTHMALIGVKPPVENRTIGIVFIVVGLVFVLVGVVFGIIKHRESGRYLTVQGRISEYELTSKRALTHKIELFARWAVETIEYTAIDGKTYRIGDRENATYFQPHVGSPRLVVYDRDKPWVARVRSFGESWLVSVLLIYGVGSVLGGLWLMGVLSSWRQRFKK